MRFELVFFSFFSFFRLFHIWMRCWRGLKVFICYFDITTPTSYYCNYYLLYWIICIIYNFSFSIIRRGPASAIVVHNRVLRHRQAIGSQSSSPPSHMCTVNANATNQAPTNSLREMDSNRSLRKRARPRQRAFGHPPRQRSS